MALAGASYDEIMSDYMISYDNYYGITRATNSKYYEIIRTRKGNRFLEYLDELDGSFWTDYERGAEGFLRLGGLTDDQIAAIKASIRK